MSIGLQAQDASPNQGGLGAIGSNAGLGTQSILPSQTDTPDNFLQYDLPNRDPNITSWGNFNVDPTIDYANLLKTAYTNPSLGKATSQWLNTQPSMGNMGGGQWENVGPMGNIPNQGGIFGQKPQTRTIYSGTPESTAQAAAIKAMHEKPGITYKDANMQAAMEAINGSLRSGGERVKESGLAGLMGQYKTTPVKYGAEYDAWDPASEETLQSTATKYGITYDDLIKSRGMYERAYKDLYDPVGANWQDLKNSPIYDKMLGGIRQYSGQSDDFYNDLNSKVTDNPYSLPAEYFALNDPNKIRAGLNGANTAAPIRSGIFGGSSNMGSMGKMGGQGFSDIKDHNPYQRTDWKDYTLGTTPWWKQTPEQMEQAKADAMHHKDLLGASFENGGAYDLGAESGYAPSYDKKKGGYRWQDSNAMNQYDIAQNMGAWNGVKEPSKLDPSATLQSGLQYMKPKKKGKGIMGILGTIAKIASFVPGPWQLPAQLVNAGMSFSSGNPLGGLMSLAGASIPGGTSIGNFGNGADGLANIGSGASALANVGNSLGGVTGLGLDMGNALASGLSGAASGASSGNALVGGLTGLSSGLGGALGSAGVNPYLAMGVGKAVPLGVNYLNQAQKNKKALEEYKARMGVA